MGQKEIDTNALQLKTESHFCIEGHVPGTSAQPPSLSCVLLHSTQWEPPTKLPCQLTLRVIFKWCVSWGSVVLCSFCMLDITVHLYVGYNHTFDILNSATEHSPSRVILGSKRTFCCVLLQVSYFLKIIA